LLATEWLAHISAARAGASKKQHTVPIEPALSTPEITQHLVRSAAAIATPLRGLRRLDHLNDGAGGASTKSHVDG
jgi:hypothetical protein